MNKLFYAVVLSSLVALNGCGEKPVQTMKELPRVRILDLSSQTDAVYDGRMFFPAIAAAADRSHLSFRLAGQVNNLNVNEGELVSKGQVIAEIDPTDFKLEVENKKASYNVADSQYRRSAPLVEKGLLAQSQFDELAAQRMIAKAEYDLAKLRLTFTQLKAPIDGIISRVNVEQFEQVQAGQQIVNIHNPHFVDIVLQVSDKLFANTPKIEDFQSVEADVKVTDGLIYTAKLKEYTTEQDQQTATYTVTLTMPMPEELLILDGMAVEVAPKKGHVGDIHTVAISIPIEAIFNPDGDTLDRLNKFVWVLQPDNTIKRTKVLTGRVSYKEIQVLSGLTNEDKIVIAGISSRLRDGMKVDLVTQEAN
ncbi:efflux RND transporter periplasmic adaptor subunit [Vibrio algarum]|uniref:Efflux RND transporter periplasmic adaptor subunit n=1 Tax=Vibrio algarum TaxID=3020714 RepID=A0ABT4YRE1_9VIBR|nr:efflux RND transporter periplasmic adaptor subunit [Vibrio sp. KJ40-1]MDB1123643.1 efflux RND transporter periplasmic adaptor subunit [Vibrio sp. KJ40-1]